PAAVLGDVDSARRELRLAHEGVDRAPVLELDGAATPPGRLDPRQPLHELLGAVVELALDGDAVGRGHERRPQPVDEEEPVPRRRPRPRDEACPGEVLVARLAAREGSVEGEERHTCAAASWPQAASMSRPRVSLTVAGSRARS